jgi:hypothetical protein
VLAGVALCAPFIVTAEDDIRWNGFLNVVGGISRDEPPSPTNPGGANSEGGTNTDFSFDNETSAGLQATKPLDESTQVTVQLLSKGNADNYAAKVQWLYLSHDLSDTQTIRAGKFGIPVYYFSDFLNVGFAYHWVRPPVQVYPFDPTYTGLNYMHRGTVGSIDWSAEVFTGTENDRLANLGIDVSGKESTGATLLATQDEWSGRLGVFTQRARFSLIDYDPNATVEQAFDTLINDPATTALAAAYLSGQQTALTADILPMLNYYTDPGYSRMTYFNAALRYETQRWFAMAEATRFYNDTYMYDDTESGMVTTGMRVGKVLYHAGVTYYHSGMTREARADLDISQQTSPPLNEIANVIGSAIKSFPAQLTSAKVLVGTVGAAIETGTNSLLKFQLDYLDSSPGEPGDSYGKGHNMTFRSALAVTF